MILTISRTKITISENFIDFSQVLFWLAGGIPQNQKVKHETTIGKQL
jgi:hypothetical protein